MALIKKKESIVRQIFFSLSSVKLALALGNISCNCIQGHPPSSKRNKYYSKWFNGFRFRILFDVSPQFRLWLCTLRGVCQCQTGSQQDTNSELTLCAPPRISHRWSPSNRTFSFFSHPSHAAAFPTVSPPKVRSLWKPRGCRSLGVDLPKSKRQCGVTYRCARCHQGEGGGSPIYWPSASQRAFACWFLNGVA